MKTLDFTAAGISNGKAHASYVWHDDWREIVSLLCYSVFATAGQTTNLSYRCRCLFIALSLFFLIDILQYDSMIQILKMQDLFIRGNTNKRTFRNETKV